MSDDDDNLWRNPFNREQRIVIDRVFAHFHATGMWPTIGQFDRPLRREEDIDAISVLRSISRTYIFFNRSYADPEMTSPIQLRLVTIALCIGSESDLNLFFEAVRWFASLEIKDRSQNASQIEITKQDYLEYLAMTPTRSFWVNATKLASMLVVEGAFFGLTILEFPDGDWKVSVQRSIRYLSSVRTMDEYQEALDNLDSGGIIPSEYVVEKVKRTLHDEAFEEIEKTSIQSATESPGERYAFVVMPFHESWSDESLKFIRNAVNLLPPAQRLEILRADDITQRGDIPLQVVESIIGASIVIADITSSEFRRRRSLKREHIPNPNVMWELGYAMALDRNGETPFVIINKYLSGSPFDLAHSRQVEYSVPASDRETERLAKVIQANLL
jgi:hypothetical protein